MHVGDEAVQFSAGSSPRETRRRLGWTFAGENEGIGIEINGGDCWVALMAGLLLSGWWSSLQSWVEWKWKWIQGSHQLLLLFFVQFRLVATIISESPVETNKCNDNIIVGVEFPCFSRLWYHRGCECCHYYYWSCICCSSSGRCRIATHSPSTGGGCERGKCVCCCCILGEGSKELPARILRLRRRRRHTYTLTGRTDEWLLLRLRVVSMIWRRILSESTAPALPCSWFWCELRVVKAWRTGWTEWRWRDCCLWMNWMIKCSNVSFSYHNSQTEVCQCYCTLE